MNCGVGPDVGEREVGVNAGKVRFQIGGHVTRLVLDFHLPKAQATSCGDYDL
jgi:hypothetical protein